MNKVTINYSQCWEDSEVLTKALRINNSDVVISVTSGGDNTLALLLCGPQKITAIDLNPAQNHLLELKLAAARRLNYDDYLSFLGVIDCTNRRGLFLKVKPYLTHKARSWWLKHQTFIDKGVINSGRFEKFLNLFRKYILPLVHSHKTITQFITTSSLEEQQEFYKSRWNTKRWRIYIRLAAGRSTLKNFARQKGMFKYAKMKNISDEYIKRLESNLKNISILDNYFLHYCLMGRFNRSLPPYLQQKNYIVLRRNKFSGLSIITNNIFTHLKSVPSNFYTKFNLSDVFEALSEQESATLWAELIRTAKNGAIVVYWDNLLPRPVPVRFYNVVKVQEPLQRKLSQEDRVFFYGSLHIYKILK